MKQHGVGLRASLAREREGAWCAGCREDDSCLGPPGGWPLHQGLGEPWKRAWYRPLRRVWSRSSVRGRPRLKQPYTRACARVQRRGAAGEPTGDEDVALLGRRAMKERRRPIGVRTRAGKWQQSRAIEAAVRECEGCEEFPAPFHSERAPHTRPRRCVRGSPAQEPGWKSSQPSHSSPRRRRAPGSCQGLFPPQRKSPRGPRHN